MAAGGASNSPIIEPISFRTHCATASAIVHRSMGGGLTVIRPLFGIIIPSSRTRSPAPHWFGPLSVGCCVNLAIDMRRTAQSDGHSCASCNGKTWTDVWLSARKGWGLERGSGTDWVQAKLQLANKSSPTNRDFMSPARSRCNLLIQQSLELDYNFQRCV
jgi:hypothetical protein